MELSKPLDLLIIFSGDGDFRSLVEALQQRGKRVSVPPMAADELRRQADQFIELTDLPKEIGRDPTERAVRRRSETEIDAYERGDLVDG